MNTQMIICMVIFAATLVSYMLNKIPMWLTAMLSLAALYFTGCTDAEGALAGFSKSALQNLMQHFKSVVDTSDFIGYP